MEKILARGAEAIITRNNELVLKNRVEKSYRHPELDKKLRKLRTRTEAKILEKASKIIHTPKLISVNETNGKIELEYIEGKKLSEHLEKADYKKICIEIGKNLANLHDNNIIHGDLTTSNMILKENKVYFIDFGLGFISSRIEDKAVDLHLIKEALQARHSAIYEEAFKNILKGYQISNNVTETIKQLEKVERRGRYKDQY